MNIKKAGVNKMPTPALLKKSTAREGYFNTKCPLALVHFV